MSDPVAELFFDLALPETTLLAVQLSSWPQTVPVPLRLIPVEAVALASMSDEPSVRVAQLGERYRRRDLARWSMHLNVPIYQGDEPLNSGPAQRAMAWVLEHVPDQALDVLIALGRQIGVAQRLDDALIAEVFDALGLPAEGMLRAIASIEAHDQLEAETIQAVQEGIFALPTLRLGRELFVGFDRLEFVAHEAWRQQLSRLPTDDVVERYTRLLLAQPDAVRVRVAEDLRALWADQTSVDEAVDEAVVADSRFAALSAALHSMPSTQSALQPMRSSPAEVSFQLLIDDTSTSLERRLEQLPEGLDDNTGLVLAPSVFASLPLQARVRQMLVDTMPRGGVLVPVHDAAGEHVLRITPRDGHDVHVVQASALSVHTLGTWCVAVLPASHAGDTGIQRALAARGVHVLMVLGLHADDPRPVAAAQRCECWVLAPETSRIRVCDEVGRQQWWPCPADGLIAPLLTWPPRHPETVDASVWRPPPPRTMLVNDEPLALGASGRGVDLGLTLQGRNLSLETPQMTSIVSGNRDFDLCHLPSGPLLVVPIADEMILASELITLKIMRALARRVRAARLLVVSYWPDGLPERKPYRVLFAATAIEHQCPVVVVTPDGPVELWLPDVEDHTAFRVDPEGERFLLDLARQPNTAVRQHLVSERVHGLTEHYLHLLMGLPSS